MIGVRRSHFQHGCQPGGYSLVREFPSDIVHLIVVFINYYEVLSKTKFSIRNIQVVLNLLAVS